MINDDELAVELVAEDERPPGAPRWPLLALLAAVVAVVILVFFMLGYGLGRIFF